MSKSNRSPIDVYRILPMTNCNECGEENCMAFAAKLVNREAVLEQCPPLLSDEFSENYHKLWEMLKPPVKEVIIGRGERAVRVGGKEVVYRHELSYVNPTAIAVDVTDGMATEEFDNRLRRIEEFTFEYIGMELTLDMAALRSTSSDPREFRSAAKRLDEASSLPTILCSFNPEVMENGLLVSGEDRPLIYGATEENWRDMADLALMYECPLTVFAPGNLSLLKSLTLTLLECGVEDLVLDPGTLPDEGLSDTLNNFTMLRLAAIKKDDETLGFPLLGVPLSVWINYEGAKEVAVWNETCLASMLITRYADVLIMHSLEGWSQLPVTILRNNLYTDPRKPVSVEAGLRSFGQPSPSSPLLFTTNFALTYYTVASDVDSGGVDCHLLVLDTEGLSVESAVAGRKLTAEKVAEALEDAEAGKAVSHRKLIIPGLSARLSGEIEELSGWEVMVGPTDSSRIPKFIKEEWTAD